VAVLIVGAGASGGSRRDAIGSSRVQRGVSDYPVDDSDWQGNDLQSDA